MKDSSRPSAETVQGRLGSLVEVIDDRALDALSRAAADKDLWTRAEANPRQYLRENGVELDESLEVGIGLFGGEKWPGRQCFRVCRSIDPVPPPPDPTGITICVQICLPGRGPGAPPGPPPPA